MKMMNKKSILLLIMAAIILTVSVAGTVAYLVTATAPVVNTFTPAEVDTEIDEDFTDKTVKENVKVTNTGDVPVYVRAKVVANWCDAQGSIVAPWTDNVIYNDTDWTNGDDGFWYHKGAVAVGGSTANLFDSYSYSSVPVEGAHLEMTIIHQSVQAVPDTTPVKELWGEAAVALVTAE